jgi:hypothetical protein
MKQKRLKHNADFKAKVAVEALREQSTYSLLYRAFAINGFCSWDLCTDFIFSILILFNFADFFAGK